MNLTATTSLRVPVPSAKTVPSGQVADAAVSTDRPEAASCTPLARPKDALAKSGMAAQAKETFSETMKEMKKNQDKAKSRDVDITKKTFWRKALGVVAAGLALGIAVAAAVATGGAAVPVAVAVIGAVVLTMSVADAWFANMSHKNAQARERGDTTMPYNIPLEGASATANLFFWSLTKAGMSDKNAKKAATYLDAGLRFGLMSATAILTLGADVALSNADRIIPILSTAASLLQSLADLKVDQDKTTEHEKAAKHVAEIQRQFDELQEANALKEAEIAALQAQIDKATAELDAQHPAPEIQEQPLLQAQPVPPYNVGATTRLMAAALLPALRRSMALMTDDNLATLQRSRGAGYVWL
jgi:hypothetical protein